MPEIKANSVSVRVSQETYDSLDAEQDRIKKETRRKPTYTELLDAAWKAYCAPRASAQSRGAKTVADPPLLDALTPEQRSLVSDLIKLLKSTDKTDKAHAETIESAMRTWRLTQKGRVKADESTEKTAGEGVLHKGRIPA